jgi:hypothetical protein
MKSQIISLLKNIIAKRLIDGKESRVNNLVGSIAHIKQFKDWLQFNYKFNNNLNIILLAFIQQNSDSFSYDSITGQVYNKDNNNSINLIKPELLYRLELNHSIDSFDDYLFVIEIIIFILKTINRSNDSIISIHLLVQLIDKSLEKQLNYYKLLINCFNEKIDDSFNSSESVLINLLKELKNFFDLDIRQKTLTINNETNFSQIEKVLTNSLFVLIKNLLLTNFYRLGRKSLESLNCLLENQYSIVSQFMNERNIELVDVINCFESQFILIEDNCLESKSKLIDINPLKMDKNRSLEFELMYKYGYQIRGLIGIVIKVGTNHSMIQSTIEFLLNGSENHCFSFKLKRDFVKIFNEEVMDLSLFLHSGDEINFDVTYVSSIEQISQNDFKFIKDLWFVTRVHKVKHSAHCFMPSNSYSLYFDQNRNSDEESDEISLTDSNDTSISSAEISSLKSFNEEN